MSRWGQSLCLAAILLAGLLQAAFAAKAAGKSNNQGKSNHQVRQERLDRGATRGAKAERNKNESVPAPNNQAVNKAGKHMDNNRVRLEPGLLPGPPQGRQRKITPLRPNVGARTLQLPTRRAAQPPLRNAVGAVISAVPPAKPVSGIGATPHGAKLEAHPTVGALAPHVVGGALPRTGAISGTALTRRGPATTAQIGGASRPVAAINGTSIKAKR